MDPELSELHEQAVQRISAKKDSQRISAKKDSQRIPPQSDSQTVSSQEESEQKQKKSKKLENPIQEPVAAAA